MTTRTALTANAKHALNSAEITNGGHLYLTAFTLFVNVIEELLGHQLVDDLGEGAPAARRYQLTLGGLRMRAYVAHQNRLRYLAGLVRADGLDGQDVADIAASVDAGEDCYVGRGSASFRTAFAEIALMVDCSGADLRQELEGFMGW